jgi:hypothetical protein
VQNATGAPTFDSIKPVSYARPYCWRQELETGSLRTITKLAASNGVIASYFTRVLRIAYLAPDIVAAIIDGKQAPS